jgi:cysteine protease ATG4
MQNQDNEAVLITEPRCVVMSSSNRVGDASVVRVEPLRFQNVDVSDQAHKNPLLRFLESTTGFSLVTDPNNTNINKRYSNPSSPERIFSNKDDMNVNATELEEIVRRDRNNQITQVGEYDACREYNCRCSDDNEDDGSSDDETSDEEEDDEGERHQAQPYQQNQQESMSMSLINTIIPRIHVNGPGGRFPLSIRRNQPRNGAVRQQRDVIYLLGRHYDAILDYDLRREDESSLFWFTYRCDFPSMDPYGITSDAGWGCMLRASQMLLAQALRLHYRGRDWRPPTAQLNQSISYRRSDPFVQNLLTWFADFPSSNSYDSGDCLYSLHNMVGAGLNHDKLPGEWYGPGTACYVLRDLVQRHERQQKVSLQTHQPKTKIDIHNSSGTFGAASRKMFRVHVASSEGAVYRDEIHNLMTRDVKKNLQTAINETQIKEGDTNRTMPSKNQPSHPLDFSAWEEELIEPSSDHEKRREFLQWDTGLLLLIPLRLGLRSFQSEYVDVVSYTFSLPQSVGVLGGRPRGARWFFGAQVNNGTGCTTSNQVFGLDPHTVQTAPRRRTAFVNGMSKVMVELSDEYLRSIHTTFVETFSLEKMDPSIALGFYCHDHADLENVFDNLQRFKELHPSSPELFNVQDSAPNYNDDSNDMMVTSTIGPDDDSTSDFHHEEEDFVVNVSNPSLLVKTTFVTDDEEEDEYVML